jgi:large subunit ribosomal protein L17
MRHRVKARTLGRSAPHRTAMYRNLVTSLFEHERIRTTDAKAKGVRSLAEKMITLGKRGDLHARRRAMRVIRRRDVAAKVFDELAERYRDRAGGYTRIVKLGARPGDAASMSIIELVESGGPAGRASKAAKAAGAKGAAKTGAKRSRRGGEKEAAKPARKAAAKSKAGKATKKASAKAAAKEKAEKKPSKKATAKKDSQSSAKQKTAAKKTATKKKAVRKMKTD